MTVLVGQTGWSMLTGRGTGFRDAGVGAEMKLPKTVTAEAKSVSTNMTRDCPFPLRRVATKKDGKMGLKTVEDLHPRDFDTHLRG